VQGLVVRDRLLALFSVFLFGKKDNFERRFLDSFGWRLIAISFFTPVYPFSYVLFYPGDLTPSTLPARSAGLHTLRPLSEFLFFFLLEKGFGFF